MCVTEPRASSPHCPLPSLLPFPQVSWTGAERFCSDSHSSTEINQLGMLPTATSMCMVSSLKASGSSAAMRGVGCFGAVCLAGGVLRVTVTAPGGSSLLVASCTHMGQLLTFPGFTGTLTCPDPQGICSPTKDLANGTGVPASAYLPMSASPFPSATRSPGPPSASPSPSLAPVVGTAVGSNQLAVSLCLALAAGGPAPLAATLLTPSVAAALRCNLAAAIALPAVVAAADVKLTASYGLVAGPAAAVAIAAGDPLNTPTVSCARLRRLLEAEAAKAAAVASAGPSSWGESTASPPSPPRGQLGGPPVKGRLGVLGEHGTHGQGGGQGRRVASAHSLTAGSGSGNAVGAVPAFGAARRRLQVSPSPSGAPDALCVAMMVTLEGGVTASSVSSGVASAQAAVQSAFSSSASVSAAFGATTTQASAAMGSPVVASAGYAVASVTPTPPPTASPPSPIGIGDVIKYLLYAAAGVAVLSVIVISVAWYSRAGKRAQQRDAIQRQQAAAITAAMQNAQARDMAIEAQEARDIAAAQEASLREGSGGGGGGGGGGGRRGSGAPSDGQGPWQQYPAAPYFNNNGGGGGGGGAQQYGVMSTNTPSTGRSNAASPFSLGPTGGGGGGATLAVGGPPRGWGLAPDAGYVVPVAAAMAPGNDPTVWYGVDATSGRPAQAVAPPASYANNGNGGGGGGGEDSYPTAPSNTPGPRGWPAHVVAASAAASPAPAGRAAKGSGGASAAASSNANTEAAAAAASRRLAPPPAVPTPLQRASRVNGASFRGVGMDPTASPSPESRELRGQQQQPRGGRPASSSSSSSSRNSPGAPPAPAPRVEDV